MAWNGVMITDILRHMYHLKTTFVSWWKRDPFTQSAAVAYYTIFSFPALMILYFATASMFVERQALQQDAYAFLSERFGQDSAGQFRSIIENTAPQDTSIWAFVVGGATLLYAGLRLFLQFQKALNYIWQVDESSVNVKTVLARRAISFGVMLGIGFTLLSSMVVTSLISVLTKWLLTYLPEYFSVLLHGMNILISFGTITVMFAVLLKLLPDAYVRWRSAFAGAMLSAVLFILGQYAMGIYFSTARPDSAYGVTGSLILLMLWVSYSCVILLLGAEHSKTLMGQSSKAVT